MDCSLVPWTPLPQISRITTKLQNPWKFSPSKVSCYTVLYSTSPFCAVRCFLQPFKHADNPVTPPSPAPHTSPHRWWSIVKLVLQLLRRGTRMVSWHLVLETSVTISSTSTFSREYAGVWGEWGGWTGRGKEREARGVRKGGKRCKGIFYNSHELTWSPYHHTCPHLHRDHQAELRHHIAKKKVPYVDAQGERYVCI